MAERAILFVIDGMRPDGLLQANAPALRRLMEQGASTLLAQTVMPSITLPTHMSLFHGVPPSVHGVTSNTYRPMPDGQIPGIFEVVRQARRRPVAFYTWDPLRDLSRPGSLAQAGFIDIYGPDGMEGLDLKISRLAAENLVETRPDFTFIYLGVTDETGHKHGWLSQPYLEAVSAADAAIAHVLEKLDSAGMLETTAILVTADHGGHGREHGADIPEDMTIPWLLAGPGIQAGYTIHGPVRIIDTAPTSATLLGLPVPAAWQGQPVLECFR